MSKFKVGDTVRFKSRKDIDYVVSCATTDNVKLWISDARNEQTSWWANTLLELVVPPKPKPKPSTYTVTWKVHPIKGYQSLIDGELSFGSQDLAEGFASLFKPVVLTTVTKD
jgi:hypothetical protein